MIEEEEARRIVLDRFASVKVITSKRQNTSEVNDSSMLFVLICIYVPQLLFIFIYFTDRHGECAL